MNRHLPRKILYVFLIIPLLAGCSMVGTTHYYSPTASSGEMSLDFRHGRAGARSTLNGPPDRIEFRNSEFDCQLMVSNDENTPLFFGLPYIPILPVFIGYPFYNHDVVSKKYPLTIMLNFRNTLKGVSVDPGQIYLAFGNGPDKIAPVKVTVRTKGKETHWTERAGLVSLPEDEYKGRWWWGQYITLQYESSSDNPTDFVLMVDGISVANNKISFPQIHFRLASDTILYFRH